MATEDTKKKTSAAEAKKTTKDAASARVTKENKELKAKLEAQDEAMKKMQTQMETLMAMLNNKTSETESEPVKNENRLIRFISLTDATVILRGTNFWAIEGGRYSYRDFPEKEARVIALNMSEYLRQGSVYIDDADFVRDNDLDIIYNTLLSDKDLKELLSKSVGDVIQTYQNVNDNQKNLIIESIIADKKAGKDIDNNILVTLGSLSGRDLINPLEEE